MYFVSREKSLIQAVRSAIRTFFLLLIPYFIITKLSYPIEFFPRPIYSISLLALISLLTANNSSVLDKVEVKFDTVKKFFSVRDRAIPTFGLFLFNCKIVLSNQENKTVVSKREKKTKDKIKQIIYLALKYQN